MFHCQTSQVFKTCEVWRALCMLALLVPAGITPTRLPAAPDAKTYYVSFSSGDDLHDGLSSGAPFKTISKVNSLSLQPGDRVLLKCGDLWRVDPLVLTKSGSATAPIEFNSYPSGCADQPTLSGSRPIGGWVAVSGNLYRADLPAADFPLGINQLFRDGQRLTLGRWPNLDAPDGGYATVYAHSAGGSQITADGSLPAGDWTGAIVHIKNIRWSMLDRQVTGSSGQTLTLNQGLSCLVESWGACAGWGYFINNSLKALDQDGEWYYDPSANRVYLYSTSGSPANMEGSVIQPLTGNLPQGGLMLSDGSATAYVIVDNLALINWFDNGIGTPGSMFGDIYHHLTIRNVTVRDVDAAGVNLSSWLERPPDGIKGLRGGHHLVFTNNLIDGANAFGVTGYFAQSTFEDNSIKNIALVKNLGKSGMGCGLASNECTENGDGFRIRLFDVAHSGFGNLLRYNRFEKIGYNGVDVFGPSNRLEYNFITQACYTKADCGAVRTFGDTSLAATTVYDLHLINNIIFDIPGNVDGCEASRAAFGMGLYIDNYSRDVEISGNTIISTTVSGILYQRSSGVASGNTVYNASSGTEFSAQLDLSGTETRVSLSDNRLYGLKTNAWTLYDYSLNNILSSDYNYFFQPYVSQHIAYGPSWSRKTFAQWKTLSGKDSHSKTSWFTQPAGQASKASAFYNASKTPLTIDLGSRQYLDLDQNPVLGSLVLDPFSSRILVDNGPAPLVLQSLQPALADGSHPADFTLTVNGIGFTTGSVVRWAGSARPTTFVSSTRLSATIYAADVSSVGDFLVTVHDPNPAPGGSETAPSTFHVAAALYDNYLPLVKK